MGISLRKYIIVIILIFTPIHFLVKGQGTYVDFNSIPKTGTILIYTHQDDDLIWMLPFWNITEKFIGGAMPATPDFRLIVRDQQIFLNNNGYNIQYESNWITPWTDITDIEYSEYYWWNNPSYYYLSVDHLETRMANDNTPLSTAEINKIKAKLEQYIASTDMTRVITHNNWGEYGHQHHRALNKAVRELAVKYRKDVWILGCTINNTQFNDIDVPDGITYTLGSFNTPDLFNGIRQIYQNYYRWTWHNDATPSGDHKFIKIVDGGSDKSNILTGESITYSGPPQSELGAYIFDGVDDYMTLRGNNNSPFTIAMRIRPDQIKEMDIARMAEYPLTSATHDRDLYMTPEGRITARIFDGSSKTVTSNIALGASAWAHIAITYNGSDFKLFVNGALQNSVNTGTPITNYSTPELVLGQASNTGSFFTGQINDVRMYNRALSDAEIADISGMIFTLNSAAGSGGTINPSGEMTVNAGTSMTFTISPSSGYRIADVRVDNVSVGTVTTYTFSQITANHTIYATFEPITYSIQATAGAGGSITPSGTVTVLLNGSQSFSITPSAGFVISDVKIDNVSAGAISSYTFSDVTSDHTISAYFNPITFIISSSSGSGGSIAPQGEVVVNYGQNRTFTITPDPDYKIVNVLVDGTSVGSVNTYTFNNIISNHTISVSFAPIQKFTINASAGTGGSVSPSGSLILNEGTNQTFNMAANTGYRIADVLVDNSSVGAVSSYTFTNIQANHTISVTFNEVPVYTINASSGAGGSIDPSGSVLVSEGSSQSFSVSPNTGFEIDNVLIDNVSVGDVSVYTFNNVTANHTISVQFKTKTYTLTSSAGAGGTITPSGSINKDHGTSQTYSITASEGFYVSDVRVDNVSVGAVNSYTFNNISANHTISAAFSRLTYTINSSAGSGGTISPQGSVTVEHGSGRTFTISTNTGYHVSDVKVDDVSVGAVTSYTFSNVTSNHTITAEFAINTYTISSNAASGGSINPSGTVTLNHGASQTYNISANFGYQVSDVIVDNISVGAVSVYTFNNITESHTINVTFETATYTITSSAGTGGTITPSGTATLTHGSDQTYTISPATGYYLSDVRVDNVSVGAVASYTFRNITSDHTITATFSRITYTITSTAGSGGNITPQGEVTAEYGTNQTFTITANTGYHIADVRVDNQSAGAVTTYIFRNITSNHTITASFEINTYTITSNAGPGGSINPSGEVTAAHGTSRIFTITPDTGYEISDVRVDNVSQGSLSQYIFSDISGNHSITASFRLRRYTITSTAGTGGTINPSGQTVVEHGTSRTFNISPSTGFRILNVTADNVSMGPINSYTFSNITENHSISATFTPITYQIPSNAEPGGSINPAGTVTVNYGTSQSFTITPGEGYLIKDVLVDNQAVGAVSTYRFTNIVADHSISASFKPITFSVTAQSGAEGSINPSGKLIVNYGDSQKFSITPGEGYEIHDVKVDNKSVGAVSEYTLINIKSNHTISVTYKLKAYTISVSSEGGGTTQPTGSVKVNHGSDYQLAFKPSEGYRVSNIKVNNISMGSDTTYILKNIKSDYNIFVIFSPLNKYNIEVSAGDGGLITPAETVTVYEGSDLTFTITPLPGFRTSNVFIDNQPVGPVVSYTFKEISSHHQISADYVNDISINLYPNPFVNNFKLEILAPEIFMFDVQIFDLKGNEVLTACDIAPGSITDFNLISQPGIYFVRVICRGTQIKVMKIIKKSQ